jgi:hypothetical protein
LPFQDGKYPFLRIRPKLNVDTKFNNLEFSKILTTLHTEYSNLYNDLKLSFFVGDGTNWVRPRPLPDEILDYTKNKISGISDTTNHRIINAISSLRPSILPLFESDNIANNYRSLTSHIYPTAGSSYSVTITFENNQPTIYFRPFLFSDTGGAGLSSVKGIVVKTKKNNEMKFSSEDMKLRREFQLGALASFDLYN